MIYSIVIGNLDVIDSLLKYGLAPIETQGVWNGETESGGIVRGHLSLIQIAHDAAINQGESHTVLIENDTRRAWIVEGESNLSELVKQHADGHWITCKVKPAGNHTYIPSIETYCEVK